MSYAQLYELLPDLAMEETRTMTVFLHNVYGLPPGDYGLVEMYCNDENCDCRRVFLMVISSVTKSPVATITFGWESKAFYAKWFNMGKDIDFSELDEFTLDSVNHLHGIHLNEASKQSKIAPKILRMVSDYLHEDKAYVDRLKRHYKLFRAKIDEQYRNK